MDAPSDSRYDCVKCFRGWVGSGLKNESGFKMNLSLSSGFSFQQKCKTGGWTSHGRRLGHLGVIWKWRGIERTLSDQTSSKD